MLTTFKKSLFFYKGIVLPWGALNEYAVAALDLLYIARFSI